MSPWKHYFKSVYGFLKVEVFETIRERYISEHFLYQSFEKFLRYSLEGFLVKSLEKILEKSLEKNVKETSNKIQKQFLQNFP